MSRWSRPSPALPLVAAAMVLGAGRCHRALPAAERADRVVMVSFDGVGADLARRWLEDGVMTEDGGLAGAARHGLATGRLRMANPTLTSVNHMCLVTGELPRRTGVVSNVFHRPATPITEAVNGFSTDCEAETLWQLARRRGRRTGVLLWPGADGLGERRGDFGFVWPTTPLARSEVVRLEPSASGEGSWPPSTDGVTALGWRLEVALPHAQPGRLILEVAAVDGTADDRPAYDRVIVRRSGEAWQLIGATGWFDLEVRAAGPDEADASLWGAWCKVLRLDPLRGEVRLSRGRSPGERPPAPPALRACHCEERP